MSLKLMSIMLLFFSFDLYASSPYKRQELEDVEDWVVVEQDEQGQFDKFCEEWPTPAESNVATQKQKLRTAKKALLAGIQSAQKKE